MPKKQSLEPVRLAVIGGSGLYDMAGIDALREVRVKTPFGDPSDAITLGKVDGVSCAFLPRHGRGHRHLPAEVPSRANMWALKSLGVERVVAISAVGSLREELAPRDFVVPDQVFDRTRARPHTFFGEGVVAHVSVDRPFCDALSDQLMKAAGDLGLTAHRGGTYVCIEGPAFSTKAESDANRRHGFSVVGMTLAPEFRLAREAELCYAAVSLVTDYDVWKQGEEVSAEKVVATLHANVANVRRLLRRALPELAGPRGCPCGEALKNAIFTAPAAMPPATRKKLDLLVGKYLAKKR